MAKVIVNMIETSSALEFEGNVEVGMNQGNSLVITEKVPDVTGKGKGEKMKVIALINATAWEYAEVE